MTYVRTFEVVLLFRHAVLKSDGVDTCLEQVKTGFAWHYKKYQHEQSLEDRRLYANAETQARNERLGLWRENNPKPPWEWRRKPQRDR